MILTSGIKIYKIIYSHVFTTTNNLNPHAVKVGKERARYLINVQSMCQYSFLDVSHFNL